MILRQLKSLSGLNLVGTKVTVDGWAELMGFYRLDVLRLPLGFSDDRVRRLEAVLPRTVIFVGPGRTHYHVKVRNPSKRPRNSD